MKRSLFVLAMLAVLVLAGCSQAPAPAAAPAPAPAPVETAPAPAVAGISGLTVPTNVEVGKPAEISWTVSGEGAVTTELRFGTKSRTDNGYTSMSPKTSLTGNAGEYKTTLVFDSPITVYFKAHAVIGGQDFWTEEQSVTFVVPAKKMAATE